MSGLPILDLVIGIIFIYFLLSIICSSAVELLFSIWGTRARLLATWLKRIFNSPAYDSHGNSMNMTLGQAIMDHCMATALSQTGKAPSYISATNFVSAFLDKVSIQKTDVADVDKQIQLPPATVDGYMEAIKNSPSISGELKRTILIYGAEAKQAYALLKEVPGAANLINNAKSEMDHFLDRLEKWYDMNCDRLTGSLKRKKVIPTTVILAVLITVGMNVDSISLSKYFYSHKEVARDFANNAMNTVESYKDRVTRMKNEQDDSTKLNDSATIAILENNIVQVRKDIAAVKDSLPSELPIGITAKTFSTTGVQLLTRVCGWLITILAICLGAPFWFDVLSKIANIRSTGPKPESKASENPEPKK